MAVPTPLDLLGPVLGDVVPYLVAGLIGLAMLLVAPRAIGPIRQAAYERAVEAEMVRLEIRVPTGFEPEPEVAVELVRALHPRQRRGVDLLRVGWPSLELRMVWRDRSWFWQIDCPRQLEPAVRVAVRSACPGVAIDAVPRDERPPTASATARLVAPDRWPLRSPDSADGRAIVRLAHALAEEPADAEVRLRVRLRPVPPDAWRRLTDPDETSTSVARLVGTAVVDALLFRESSSPQPVPRTISATERDAAKRKRAGVVGFEVGAALEVGGVGRDAARALLWRLWSFTDVLGDARQSITWQLRGGSRRLVPSMRLADWEAAALWSLPTSAFDRTGAARSSPLVAPASPPAGPRALVIGEADGRPVGLPLDVLGRHLAVFGATGSGKSTLLLGLATELLRTGVGGTIIDPHGDLADDILARVPEQALERVHVLRLADRAHPRGFNFLERRTPDEAQLVTSEFVGMLEDLWQRFCGPKMQDYLRHGLLTLLAQERPQTILELVRLLTDDAFREAYTKELADPLLASWWRTQWPGPRERERDTSIKAVLNKLGAFVAYDSIRHVIGQGTSTIRPRTLMDRGDVLVVDLSQVGEDNASLFGAMLISRYYIDAVGRQGTPRESRRPHVLVVDEAQRFDTRALGRIYVEGRKFGLILALASQSLAGLGERLRSTILTNSASLALLSPGSDDVRGIARLFDPVAADRLSNLRRFEFVLRTPGRDGSPTVYGGRVVEPGEIDPGCIGRVIAASDLRDARPVADVRAEVHRRAGGNGAPKAAEPTGSAGSDER
jgi:DNA helicase HerA-like ATPase